MRGFAKMIESTGLLCAAAHVITVALAVTITPTIASAAVSTASSCTNMDSTAPSLPDFLKASRPLNPSYSEEEITRVWIRTYQSNCTFWLEGRIGPDDVAIFKRSLEKAGSNGRLMLYLNSEGGDLTTALEIGRLVRRWPNSSVMVLQDAKCLSACVFVLAGGLHRRVDGNVGIHRPFNATTNSNTYESTQKTFRTLEQSAKVFLKDMNVPTSLYDEMMSVPSQKLRLLTEQELAQFGIGQSDPAYQDNLDAEAARAYGLDKEAYLRRKERADRICEALYVNTEKAGIEMTSDESVDIQLACKQAVLANKTERLLEEGKLVHDQAERLLKDLSDRRR